MVGYLLVKLDSPEKGDKEGNKKGSLFRKPFLLNYLPIQIVKHHLQ